MNNISERKDARNKKEIDRLKEIARLEKEILKTKKEEGEVDDIPFDTKKIFDELKKEQEDAAEFAEKHPFWANLGIENEEQLNAIKKLANEAVSILESYVQAQVQAKEQITEQFNQRILEQESAIQTEIALNKEGSASNIAAKQKELTELKRMRDDALEAQLKAQQLEQRIQQVQMGLNLAQAVSQIIRETTKTGPGWLSIPIAAAAIAAMFGIFGNSKAQASALTKFAGGGVIDGEPHSKGGVKIPEMGIELEGGEYVVNKKSTKKYGNLIEAINSDNLARVNMELIDKLGDNRPLVYFDDKGHLGNIEMLLRNQSKAKRNVTFENGKRVLRHGIITRYYN